MNLTNYANTRKVTEGHSLNKFFIDTHVHGNAVDLIFSNYSYQSVLKHNSIVNSSYFLQLQRKSYIKKFSNNSTQTLLDLSCIDYLGLGEKLKLLRGRFNLFLVLGSLHFYNIIFVQIFSLAPSTLSVPSFIRVYKSANWLERECWDMFGILFMGHTDLRRILTDYGFSGFPLRKDFPLVGFLELNYDEEFLQLTDFKVSLAQELRINNTI